VTEQDLLAPEAARVAEWEEAAVPAAAGEDEGPVVRAPAAGASARPAAQRRCTGRVFPALR